MQTQHPKNSVIGIIGWSGSGKTTLLEKTIPLLIDAGLKVNVVKSSHHDVELEPPHKDSARLRRSGASEVLLASPYRFAIMHELDGNELPALNALISRMQEADITLIEGFKHERIPKLEVYRPSLGKSPMFPTDNTILAVISDAPRPKDIQENLDWLDLNDTTQVAVWLRKFCTTNQSSGHE
ncbi:MAG: molybdopterin-guanine dinucleotide biosynthesis protein B [Oxalobacter sp.]|nr:molybdopterin-guanine dinucleotide biosynthesis protein B [Oxalobacter sp.]